MIEIAILIVIVILYFKTAQERKKNPWIWSLIAILGFYGPIFLIGIVLGVIGKGTFIEENPFIVMIIGIVIGVLSCTIVKKRVLEK